MPCCQHEEYVREGRTAENPGAPSAPNPAHQGRPRLGKNALSNGRGAQGRPPPASEWFRGPRGTTHAIPYSAS